MKRDSVKELLEELKANKNILGIKAYSEYRRNGIIVKVKLAKTGFLYDRELILSDGTSVIAWI